MINIDKRWLLAIGLGAAAGAAVTSQVLRRRQRMAQHRDHFEDLKSWENEGGSLAAPLATSVHVNERPTS
jgi:hypothetical protein